MEVEMEIIENAVIASICGRVDTVSAPALTTGLAEALARPEKILVLDLAGLEYISSAGLRVILGAAKSMKAKGGELRLAAMSGSVQKVLQISGFFAMFKNFSTRAEALAVS